MLISLAGLGVIYLIGTVMYLILAIRPPGEASWEYTPRPTSRLAAGSSLMAMASSEELTRLRALAAGDRELTETGTLWRESPGPAKEG